MLEILNIEQARKWVDENLYEADLYLFPLSVCVKNGLLIDIDGEHFAVTETECFGCTWVIDEIKRLSDAEMEHYGLSCRYRYKAHTIAKPNNYSGITEIEAGFNI